MTNPGDDDHGPASGPAPDAAAGPPGESPVQRALRLKQARLDARPKPPRGGRFQREQAAGVAAGASRPWTHK
jgi:hypothetical protein